MQFVSLTPDTITRLSEAASRADANNQTLRIQVVSNNQSNTDRGWIKWKVGEGVWTPAYYAREEL